MRRRSSRISRLATLAIAAALAPLSSCAVGPNYEPPKPDVPASYVDQPPTPPAAAAQPDMTHWWLALRDDELNSLVTRAVASNLDLGIALDRLAEARLGETVVTGAMLPHASFSASGARGTGSDLARGRAGGSLVSADHTADVGQITDIAGFDGAWEIDLFGHYRRDLEAASANTEALQAARDGALLSVESDVARAYVDLRALQLDLAVLRKNIDVAEQYARFTSERYNRGITNELDVTLATRQLESYRAEEEPLLAKIHAARDVIAVLLGEYPEKLAAELDVPGDVPSGPMTVQTGAPLDLLRRRPDIRESERNLAAAVARVGVAESDLFPRLTLLGGAGYEEQGLDVQPHVSQSIWSLGPALSMPILDFGQADAVAQRAELKSHDALLSYKRTVLNAVRDVDTAADAYRAQQDELGHLEHALGASKHAVELATERFDRGLTDSLNVIDAQRQEFVLEQQYVAARKDSAEEFIGLAKALGGGWEGFEVEGEGEVRTPLPALVAAGRKVFSSW